MSSIESVVHARGIRFGLSNLCCEQLQLCLLLMSMSDVCCLVRGRLFSYVVSKLCFEQLRKARGT